MAMERQVLRRGTWSKVQACSRRTFHRSVISSAFGLLLVTVSASYLTPMLVTQVCGPGRILVLYYLPWLEVYQIRTFNMYVWTYIHVCDMHMKYMVTRVWNYGSISVLNKRHLMLIITILILFHRCFVSIARTKVAYLFLVLYNLKKHKDCSMSLYEAIMELLFHSCPGNPHLNLLNWTNVLIPT